MFETSAFITLHPESPGIDRYDLPHKLNDELREIFPDGQPITKESGARLRKWAETGNDLRETEAEKKIREGVLALIERIEDARSGADLEKIKADEQFQSRRDWLRGNRLDMSRRLENALADTEARFAPAMEDGEMP